MMNRPLRLPSLDTAFSLADLAASDSPLTNGCECPITNPCTPWYLAEGLLLRMKLAHQPAEASLHFSVMLLTDRSVTAFDGEGNEASRGPATLWTSDSFGGDRHRTTTPEVYAERSTLYYSDDEEESWQSLTARDTTEDGYFGLELKDARSDSLLLYIPMDEFYYYGGLHRESGIPHGVTALNRGYLPFVTAIRRLSADQAPLALSALRFCVCPDKTRATVSATVSAPALVYRTQRETVEERCRRLRTPERMETLPTELTLTERPVTESPLYGRSAVYAGDSLTYAYRDKEADGWAGRLGTKYDMTYANVGIGGKTISAHASVISGKTVYNQLADMITAQSERERSKVSYVILNGGINDLNRNGDAGEVADDTRFFDLTTLAGGLEYAIQVAREGFPNATVGFILSYRMPRAVSLGKPLVCTDLTRAARWTDTLKRVCEKWRVPYLNLFDDIVFNEQILRVDTDEYMDPNDHLHIRSNGYILLTPYVGAWMEQIRPL